MPDYKIGFTFVGKYRNDYIRPVCEELRELGFSEDDIFFDGWHIPEINGANADERLQDIYYKRCELVVVLLSPDYNTNYWTGNVEWPAVRALIEDYQRRDSVYLLGIDNVDVDEISGLFAAHTILDYLDNPDYGKDSIKIVSRHIKEKYEFVINRPLKQMTEDLRNFIDRENIEKDLDDSKGHDFLSKLDTYKGRKLELSQWFEYGYRLTDAYERAKKFDMSTKIAKELLSLMEEEADIFRFDEYKKIRYNIGLVYSLSIAKVRDLQHSENLQIARNAMDGRIKEELIHSSLMEDQKNELWGLYHSNYGALDLNEGLLAKSQGDQKTADEDFRAALGHHEEALEIRKKLAEKYSKHKSYEVYTHANSDVTQSMSNIASTLFQLGNYEDAIEKHRTVMYRWEGIGQNDKAYTSRKYMLGCYIEKWTGDRRISSEEEPEFLHLLEKCKSYYTDANSFSYAEIKRREEQYHDLKRKHT